MKPENALWAMFAQGCKRCGFVIGLASLILLHITAFAEDLVAVPNRPTISTTAQPVQPGVLETEFGLDAASSRQDINALLKFGVSDNFELRFTNNPLVADSGTHGFGDTGFGFKYRLTKDSGYEPSIAFMYMVKTPTASRDLGSGRLDHSFAFLASKDLGKHHWDFNFIANVLGSLQGGFDRSYFNALAWSRPVRGKWGTTAEISGTTSPNRFTPGTGQLLASATYTPRPRLVLDFGVLGRLTGNIPDAIFVTGFTYSIADLYRGSR
jgi:hypothetical protein